MTDLLAAVITPEAQAAGELGFFQGRAVRLEAHNVNSGTVFG